jgi:hypothetical protein
MYPFRSELSWHVSRVLDGRNVDTVQFPLFANVQATCVTLDPGLSVSCVSV